MIPPYDTARVDTSLASVPMTVACHIDAKNVIHQGIDWTPLVVALRATAVMSRGTTDEAFAGILEDLAFYLSHPEEATETIKVGGKWGK